MTTPTRTQSAQGGRTAASGNQRDRDGRFKQGAKPDRGPKTPNFVDVRATRADDHFDPKPIPPRIAAQRPWPQISGSRRRMLYAVSHLRSVAAAAGISIKVLPKGQGDAGRFDPRTKTIQIAAEVMDDPALYAYVVAHEMGHALDPRFAALGAQEYKNPRYETNYEIVAEESARRALESFGLILDDDDGFLVMLHRRWRRRVEGPLNDRVRSTSILQRPWSPGTHLAAQEARRRRRAQRRARAAARRDLKKYKPPRKLPKIPRLF